MDHLGPSHCFVQSQPSLHPSCQSDPPDLTSPTSHRRTVWTGRSPHRFLSPFKFPRPWDRCDRPHLFNFLAVVLPFCSSGSPCATRHLSVLVSPLHVFLHVFFLLQVLSPVSLRASPHPQRRAAADPTPLGLRFCHRRRISPLRPAPSHLQRFVTVVRKWQRVSTSGLADCRMQKGGSWRSAKTLPLAFSCAFLIRLALLVGFFLSFTPRFVFSFTARPSGSRFTTIYGTCWYGRKTKGFGNWMGRVLDGAQLDPALGMH